MNSKNMTLELLKLFASYMVVFIHVPFYGDIDTVMDALARFAVPFFFFVSGFFSCKLSLSKIKERIKHLLFLIIISFASYMLFQTAEMIFDGNISGIAAFFQQFLNIKSIIKFFVFNHSICSVHLWYLYAILYVYAVLYLATRLNIGKKTMYIISASLLGLNLLLGEGLSVFGISVPKIIVRNFALTGIPFFALGMFAKENENKLRDTPKYIPIIFAIIGILETVFSRYFFGMKELYLGSLFSLFAVVIFFIKKPNTKYPEFFVHLSGCSTYVYIFHIMLAKLIRKFYDIFHIHYATPVVQNIHPILVCVVSTIFAFAIRQIQKHRHKTHAQINHKT